MAVLVVVVVCVVVQVVVPDADWVVIWLGVRASASSVGAPVGEFVCAKNGDVVGAGVGHLLHVIGHAAAKYVHAMTGSAEH